MAIEKRFIHFKKFSDFNSKKLSANEANTQYTVGISGAIQTGSPDVLYQSYVWIKDTQQQWTHGQIYNGSDVDIDPSQYISKEDVDAEFSETSTNPIQNQAVTNTLNTLESVISGLLELKQPIISDLEAIRDGASKGATALQASDVDSEMSDSSTNPIQNKAFTKEFMQLIEDVDLALESKQDNVEDLQTIREGAAKGATAVQPDAISEFITIDDVAKVATSGDYNDLTNKPTIPSAVTESTVSGWGFTKNTGTYSKPSGGIPQSDLAEEVKGALRKAEQYTGTVTEIKVNGNNIGASGGVVDLGNLGTYSKPSTGIPKSDLNSSVQASLGKADTAVQPADIKDDVYIADFTMESLRNGMNNGGQVNCDMQALITAMNANKVILVRECEDSSYKGVHVLNGYAEDLLYFSIVDTSGNILWCNGTDYNSQFIDGQTLRFRSWADKQDALVSGNNIKTINGESIVGSGDITITGGSGTITGVSANGTSIATSGVANIPAATTSKYGVTKLTTLTNSSSTTLAATASAVKAAYDLAKSFVPMTLNTSTTSFWTSLRWSPNQKYASTAVLGNNVTFNIDVSSIDTTKDNTWALSFILGTSARTISFAVSQTGYTIMWANGVAPTFEPNTAYEITFKLVGTNLFGVCGAFKTV